MKHIIPNSICTARRALGFALALFAAAQVNAAEIGKTFATPEEAVAALANGKMKRKAHDFEGEQKIGEDDGRVDLEELRRFNRDSSRDLRPLADFDQGIF